MVFGAHVIIYSKDATVASHAAETAGSTSIGRLPKSGRTSRSRNCPADQLRRSCRRFVEWKAPLAG